jgi:hypothetical protein
MTASSSLVTPAAFLAAGADLSALDPASLAELAKLDHSLFQAWNMGEFIMVAWSREPDGVCVLAAPHYRIVEPHGGGCGSEADSRYHEEINQVLAGAKLISPEAMRHLRHTLGSDARQVRVTLRADSAVSAELVTSLVTRYGVTRVNERAVALLDIVGFSLRTPFEQVAMLNSLSYSVNSACRQLLSRNVEIDFARTTTGDGFYLWNRTRSLEANIALYKLLMLILTDNAVARRKSKGFPVPTLRAALHVGEHYEFYQVEGLNPTPFSYIVGHVTIELARMLAGALPGQILIGDFTLADQAADSGGAGVPAEAAAHIGPPEFIERTASMLDRLKGMQVSGDCIRDIRCYLTGDSAPDGAYRIRRYPITDKHGMEHWVYNAKLNIHLSSGAPIFLGIQNSELGALRLSEVPPEDPPANG